MGAAGARHTSGSVGRLAFLRARMAVAQDPQPQHVYADRLRCGDRVPVQPRRDAPARHIPASLPRSLGPGRSEEHTSELQSLMRISYAVFCLNNKKIRYTVV